MKRLICLALILIMTAALWSCSPDNIIAPETVTPDTEQNKTEQDKPQQDNPADKNTDTQAKDEPVSHPTHTDKKEKNNNILPTFDVNTLDYLNLKTDALKEKSLTLFTGDSSFTAAGLSEKDWIAKICENYGVSLDLSVTTDAKLYESQLISQTAGKKLDIVSVRLDNMVSPLALIRSANDIIVPNGNDPFSKKVFELSGGKLFSGIGNAKVLWYNKKIIKQDPKNDWTFEEFAKTFDAAKSANAAFLETDDFVEFFSCGEQQITGFDAQNGYIMNAQDKTARDMVAEFAKLTNAENMLPSVDKTFAKGTAAYVYTATPIKRNLTVNWVPLPRYTEQGTNVMSLCGSALGLSKDISEENIDAALTFIMLWSARYTEAREDQLLFDIGISSASCDQYISLCEQNGRIYEADSFINSCFTGTGIPFTYYLDDPYNGVAPSVSSTYYSVPDAYERAELINKRYK